MARLRYVLAHGVKEGLVASPYDWPGVHCARALADGTPVAGHWRDRTLESRARRKGNPLDPREFVEREELSLAPLPCCEALAPEEYQALVRELIQEIEKGAQLKREETGMAPLGRDAICRQDPHQEPNRMKRDPAPLAHSVAPEVRRALRKSYLAFCEAYRYAARRLREGAKDIEFPVGAFPPPLPVRIASRSG